MQIPRMFFAIKPPNVSFLGGHWFCSSHPPRRMFYFAITGLHSKNCHHLGCCRNFVIPVPAKRSFACCKEEACTLLWSLSNLKNVHDMELYTVVVNLKMLCLCRGRTVQKVRNVYMHSMYEANGGGRRRRAWEWHPKYKRSRQKPDHPG